jgi:FAD binding domain/D-arabinono-1,4-lactone oxidase
LVEGEIATALLPSGKLSVVTRGLEGVILLRHLEKGKWSRPEPVGGTKGGFSGPRALAVDTNTAMITAVGPGETLWYTNHARRWIDSELRMRGPVVPVVFRDHKIDILSPSNLHAHFLPRGKLIHVAVQIDAVDPATLFEDDDLTVRYTLENPTQKTATGAVSAWLDNAPLHPVGPPLTPLASGQTAHGEFTLGAFQHLTPGVHHINLHYVKYAGDGPKIIRVPWVNGAEREITIGDIEESADDTLAINVVSYQDPFPTDDPPVTGGPITCLAVGPDVQTEIHSYNFLTLAEKIQGVLDPKTLGEVQAAIQVAGVFGSRVRVVGAQHSSNAQLCTEGAVIRTTDLRGAAPMLPGTWVGSPPFDTSADLSGAPPVLEDFQGRKTVRVGPGMQLGDLMKWLDDQGWSLGFAVPGFRKPTVGGAIATGTHGSSPIQSVVISSRVRWLLVVRADGTFGEYSEQTTDSDTWKALRAHLGFLGVVVQLRLEVEAAFNLRVKVRWVTAKDLVGPNGPHGLLTGADWGEMVWFPQEGDPDAAVMVLSGRKTTDPAGEGVENRLLRPSMPFAEEAISNFVLDQMESDVCGGTSLCRFERLRADLLKYAFPPYTTTDQLIGIIKVLEDVPELAAALVGMLLAVPEVSPLLLPLLPILPIVALFIDKAEPEVVAKWHLAMSSDLTPYQPFQRDWEIFIPKSRARDALQAAMAYFKTNKLCLPLIGVFIRFAPAEDTTLLAHTVAMGEFVAGEPGTFFEMPVFIPKKLTCSDQARYEKVYSDLAEMLVHDYGGRAHWGKNRASLFQLERRLNKYGANLKTFRQIAKRMDPTGMFANQFGVDMGLRWPKAPPVPSDTETKGCVPG